jgi:NadR type nicotinamide-nucleotide adenylyltransferase
VLKIVITGPESSGKTSLAQALAQHFRAPLVPEFARTFLEQHGPAYVEKDLLTMAQGQVVVEERAQKSGPALVVCDTDLITVRIWSEEKFGRCHPWILQQTEQRVYDLWLLCKPDLPWAPDPLRENPDDRDRLFERYADLLDALGKPYMIISGEGPLRTSLAVGIVEGLVAEAE